jgi:hypothetical protein
MPSAVSLNDVHIDLRANNSCTGLSNLRKYFELIVFQAYLQTIEPDTVRSMPTFEEFVRDRPG